jgi:hypothetical protein
LEARRFADGDRLDPTRALPGLGAGLDAAHDHGVSDLTGLAKFPFKEFALNEVWLEIVMLAHDLIVWTQALVLDGELAKAEPKRLRYRLLHVAGRLAFSGRRAKLHLQDTWPWAAELLAAFEKLKPLAAASG